MLLDRIGRRPEALSGLALALQLDPHHANAERELRRLRAGA